MTDKHGVVKKERRVLNASEDSAMSDEVNATPLWGSARFTLAILSFFGFINFYALRVNMSITIVCMVNHTALRHQEYGREHGGNISKLLSRVDNTSSSLVCGVDQGDEMDDANNEGTVSPAMQSLWSHWAPPLESSRLRSICFAGSQIGRALTFPVAALLCEYGFDGGWPSIFYVQGIYGVLWFIGWYLLVFDTPAAHPRISNEEKRYIQKSLEERMKLHSKKTSTPWRAIFTSVPVWTIIICHTCSNWGDYTFLTNIPTYMKEVLQFDIKKNGFASALPYLCFWVAICVSSWLADLLRARNILGTTGTRKLCNSIGSFIPAALLLVLSHLDCTQSVVAVAVLSLGVSLSGFQYGGGLFINPGDIAPQYAGLLYGISNTVATLPGFLAPLAIGLLTPDQTAEQWSYVFYLSAGIITLGGLLYVILGTGNLQPWAQVTEEIIIEVDGVVIDESEI